MIYECGGSGPLEGVRVVDFGHVWAGPYCAATLGDLGAEVIKVESRQRLDVHRRQGPHPNGLQHCDASGVWNAQNRGKRSVTLNLATEGGRDLARRLVMHSDIVVENFRPGVMARLGLSYESLSASHPELIYASLSAFGQRGPQSHYVGYGPSLDAWAGLDSLTRYGDGPPQSLGGVFPDTGSALFAAVSIVALLIKRYDTHCGGFVDLSELEVTCRLIGGTLSSSLRDAGMGFPADSERSIPIRSCDHLWAFVRAADVSSIESLLKVPDEFGGLDSQTGARATSMVRSDFVSACVEAGIAVAPVFGVDEVLGEVARSNPYYLRFLSHEYTSELPIYGPIWRFSETPATADKAAPKLGEGNMYVLHDILGLGQRDVDHLIASGAVF